MLDSMEFMQTRLEMAGYETTSAASADKFRGIHDCTRTLFEQFFMISPGQFTFQIRRQPLCNFLRTISCIG